MCPPVPSLICSLQDFVPIRSTVLQQSSQPESRPVCSSRVGNLIARSPLCPDFQNVWSSSKWPASPALSKPSTTDRYLCSCPAIGSHLCVCKASKQPLCALPETSVPVLLHCPPLVTFSRGVGGCTLESESTLSQSCQP